MKKKWLKKGSAILLAAAMVMSLFPGMTGTLATVQAAGNEAPTSGYWTDATGLKEYNLSSSSTTIGKIKFGAKDRLWAICGTDGDNLALLSTSEFAQAEYGGTSEYSKSKFVNNLTTDSNGYLTTTYFSTGETGKMADVTVSTNEPDVNGGNTSISVADKKLYLPNSQNEKSYGEDVTTIYVGSSNNIDIDVTKLNNGNGFQTNVFWLRSPGRSISSGALVAYPGDGVGGSNVSDDDVSVVPAFNLNLSSDIFASAAEAASSTGYIANSAMTENTYTLRYTYTTGIDSAVINPSGTQVKVTNANNKYLMVQNSTGVYALAIGSNDATVNASDIQMGDNAADKLDNFNNCKVWIESTNEDRITTAKLATQATVTTINSVALTDITAPVAGQALDTTAACATTGVSGTAPTVTWTQGGEAATGNAGYNTTYTASVTLTAAENYKFASGVTATVNGQSATSITKNLDGTVTVTYEFPATNMAKLISVTAPTGITVANGTAYAAMGLPTDVAIVTEGNTVTTTAVVWDTTTPAIGSYNPAVLTEQSVTLNGTVTRPSNIDQNEVSLTTKITVTISAAGIVGTPTFAPAAGTYTENQLVILSSSTDGATIYYTTDGSTPTTDSNVYSGAISVTGTAGQSISTTIKAIAVKDGMQNSSVASATYVIEIPRINIPSIEVTDITAPVAGSALDITAACATTGVSSTAPTVTWTQGGEAATGNAGYNTTYTASVTLTAAENYEFASGVTATVNGQDATGITKNPNGTITVTYAFPVTDMAKLISITAPTAITVANGTAYGNMGLPANVAIVTEGNTETTASVEWNTTTPDSGSYDPAVLTEQSVTLNGTVTRPSNIDQNEVSLTTKITVTISAAGIVGTPTFAPAAGTYTENQLVILSSSTDGATIYYTTDGSTPTTDSNVYSGAISVTGTAGQSISTTIKAIAVKDGMQNSSVASATYVIELPAPAPSTYAVTVNNGTGDGSYAAGATVTITADTAPSGQEFDKWTVMSGGVTLASTTSAATTFEMPANAVEVTANYKNKPSDPNPPAPAPTYTITAGAGGTHELSTDGTLTITCDGALDKLTGIYVDDKLVDTAHYTLKSGSTILTFKAAYLNTLSAGTHKVKFQYSDGSVETTFVINKASTEDTTQETTTPSEKDEVPKTGDSTPIAWLFIVAIISGAGVVYFGKKKKTVR